MKQTETTPSADTAASVARVPLRRAIAALRLEERCLLGLWLFGLLVCLSTGTGFYFWPVFRGYLGFFGVFVVYLFAASRCAYWIAERWRPRSRAGTWLHRFVFGAAERRALLLDNDLELVRGAMLLFATLSVYSNVKVRIPFINSTVADSTYEAMDHALFGQSFIARIEAWFAGDPAVVDFFDHVYMHDYRYMMVLVFLLYLRRDAFHLRWTMIAVCFTYLISILVTVAAPSYGPCYADSDRFAWLQQYRMGGIQNGLANFHDYSVQLVAAGKDIQTRPFLGIAAFPSLHVGHMIVMLVVALRVWPAYAAWMLLVSALTFIATIGFGWHYVVDGVGGMLIAVGVTHLLYKRMRAWDVKSGT